MDADHNSENLSQPPMMLINDQKAGMKGLDKEKINRLIYEASKGTPYYENQLRKEEAIAKQCAEMLEKIRKFDDQARSSARKKMDALANEIQLERFTLQKIVVHIDMDMFYAAVEIKDNPSLSNVPMAVGTMSMLSTSNYLARTYGIRAGMAGFIAKKLCPDVKIIPCNFKRYGEVSDEVMNVLSEYDADYSTMGLDEAYLDITDFVLKKVTENNDDAQSLSQSEILPRQVWDTAFEVVAEMRRKVFEKTGLTCSAGIAPNTMLAKICTDLNKPNGQFMVVGSPDIVESFIQETDVRKVPGIGPVQQKYLNCLGIQTCKDLWHQREILPLVFKPSLVHFYLRVSLGIGSTTVKTEEESVRKSKGLERTFPASGDTSQLLDILSGICRDVSKRLKSRSLKGRTVVLRLKRDTFVVNTRNKTLPFCTDDEEVLFRTTKQMLLAEIRPGVAFRLLGVRVCNFKEDDIDAETEPPQDVQKQLTLDNFFVNQGDNVDEESCSRGSWEPANYDSDDEFICAMCGREFNSAETLVLHVEECDQEPNMSVLSNSKIEKSSESSSAEIYSCPVCEQAKFSDLSILNRHVDECLNRSPKAERKEGKRKCEESPGSSKSRKMFISDYFSKPDGR